MQCRARQSEGQGREHAAIEMVRPGRGAGSRLGKDVGGGGREGQEAQARPPPPRPPNLWVCWGPRDCISYGMAGRQWIFAEVLALWTKLRPQSR